MKSFENLKKNKIKMIYSGGFLRKWHVAKQGSFLRNPPVKIARKPPVETNDFYRERCFHRRFLGRNGQFYFTDAR
jgi:hypothetical protein